MVFSPWDKHRFVVTSALNDDVGVDGCGCYSISSGGVCVSERALTKQQTVVNQQHVILKEIHFMSILSFSCCCLSRYLCVCCSYIDILFRQLARAAKINSVFCNTVCYTRMLCWFIEIYLDRAAAVLSCFIYCKLKNVKQNFNFATCINQTKTTRATKKSAARSIINNNMTAHARVSIEKDKKKTLAEKKYRQSKQEEKRVNIKNTLLYDTRKAAEQQQQQQRGKGAQRRQKRQRSSGSSSSALMNDIMGGVWQAWRTSDRQVTAREWGREKERGKGLKESSLWIFSFFFSFCNVYHT